MLHPDSWKQKDTENYMVIKMYTLSKEHLNFIVRVSILLSNSNKFNKNWNFSVRRYLDGFQFNWTCGRHSLMWRSSGWDEDHLEYYSGSDTTDIILISELDHVK